jgi:hypothetical protein
MKVRSTSKSPNSYINSLLYRFLHFPLALTPPDIRFKTFLSKVTSRLAISLFKVQDSVSYVSTGLNNVFEIFIFSAAIPIIPASN